MTNNVPVAVTKMAGEAETPQIPDKLYFRIGEVSRLAGVKSYVLRYWETEFPGLSPRKSGRDHRLYRRKDVELVLEIKRLLYEKRFTIEGARKHLESRAKESKPGRGAAPAAQGQLFPPAGTQKAVDAIRRELQEILTLLG
jgi:DNA-binding transcriptional MerR regulator